MGIGKIVRQLRKERGWKLEELSRRSGVAVGTISAIEVRDSVRSEYATQLAHGLGVPVSVLLGTPTSPDFPALVGGSAGPGLATARDAFAVLGALLKGADPLTIAQATPLLEQLLKTPELAAELGERMDATIAKYGVLAHYPQRNRTEHVNIGIVTFLPQGQSRVHFAQDLRKLRCVDPSVNIETVRSWESGLPKIMQGQSVEQAIALLRNFGQWRLSDAMGQFLYRSEEEYLARVANALHSLVATPPKSDRDRGDVSRLHVDLKTVFRAKGWLGYNIGNHEIVERYALGPMTTAEFALQNDSLHVIESLDLRTSNPSAKRNDARSKALTLDMARKAAKGATRYAVLAGIDSPLLKDAQNLLADYSEEIFTWESAQDMEDLMRRLGVITKKPGLEMPLPG